MRPLVTNNPATLVVVKLAMISETPLMVNPAMRTFLAPYLLMRLEFGMAKIERQALASEPTKARVEGGARPSRTRAACITPKEYVDPAWKKLKPISPDFGADRAEGGWWKGG